MSKYSKIRNEHTVTFHSGGAGCGHRLASFHYSFTAALSTFTPKLELPHSRHHSPCLGLGPSPLALTSPLVAPLPGYRRHPLRCHHSRKGNRPTLDLEAHEPPVPHLSATQACSASPSSPPDTPHGTATLSPPATCRCPFLPPSPQPKSVVFPQPHPEVSLVVSHPVPWQWTPPQ